MATGLHHHLLHPLHADDAFQSVRHGNVHPHIQQVIFFFILFLVFLISSHIHQTKAATPTPRPMAISFRLVSASHFSSSMSICAAVSSVVRTPTCCSINSFCSARTGAWMGSLLSELRAVRCLWYYFYLFGSIDTFIRATEWSRHHTGWWMNAHSLIPLFRYLRYPILKIGRLLKVVHCYEIYFLNHKDLSGQHSSGAVGQCCSKLL